MKLRSITRAALPAALLLSVVAAAVSAAEGAPDFGRALKAADASIVRVRATVMTSGDPAKGPATFTNTGFLISDDGYVVTSLLAVAGSSQIRVVCPDARTADARPVAMDQAAGLVLLKCDLPGTMPLTFAPGSPALGEWVALAFAGRDAAQGTEEAATLEPAHVTAQDAAVNLNGFRWDGLLRASTRVCNGCAASPLLDRDGHVVGVVLAVKCAEPPSSVWQACDAYGLPADEVQAIVGKLRRGESRRLGWLGVAVAAEPGDREGAQVAAVLERSPAHLAGIRPGDLVLEINETAIESPSGVAELVAQAGPVPGMKMKLLRGGQLMQVTVDLQPRPLAICSAPARLTVEAPITVQQLMDENRRLRLRVLELEAASRQMQDRLHQLEQAPSR
jgi:S1-C subfamily serine protease